VVVVVDVDVVDVDVVELLVVEDELGGAVDGAGVVGGNRVVGTGMLSRRYGHAHVPVVA